MSELDLPYTAEYAKSNRSSCKLCKAGIGKGELRMGVMIQAPKFDAKIPLWHHFDCFFSKKKVASAGDIAFFNGLRWEDQEKIKGRLGGVGAEEPAASNSSEKKKKSKAKAAQASGTGSVEFSVEYAKSSKSVCRVCTEKIMKGEVRVSKLDYDSDTARRFGPVPGWHHLNCFVEAQEELGYTESGSELPGFSNLSEEDQEEVKKKIKGSGAKKRKSEVPESEAPVAKKVKKEDAKEEQALKAQSKMFFGYRDKLEKCLVKKEWKALMDFNAQEPPAPGDAVTLDLLADCMCFGALQRCPECKEGQLQYRRNGYKCTGYISGWTKCVYITQQPERKAFQIPDDLKEQHDFLKKYKYVKRERLFPSNPDMPSERVLAAQASVKPLERFKVAIVGDLSREKSAAESLIIKSGGKVLKKPDKNTTFIVTTKTEAENKKKFKTAETHGIYVVSEEILDDLVKVNGDGMMPMLMKKYALFSWGKEPEEVLPKSKIQKSSSASTSGSQVVKMSAHAKAAVDPSTGLEGSYHVVEKNGEVYNAILGKVDVVKGTNSYYKLQLLKHNDANTYIVYRAWGRVGTDIGDNKKSKFQNFDEALESFEKVYHEQTGNYWEDRENFVKQPRGYYPLDIDYGQEQADKMRKLMPGSNSKLPLTVQELICMIFDVEAMKQAMLEFEIDLKKMPLGKLSKKQIQSAYLVLTEVQNLLKDENKSETKILDASNRFYTLIPHDFGMKKPPLLDNDILLQSKIEMLDSLLEIEVAYHLLQENMESQADPIDQHYEQLKTDIEVLDKATDEFKRIELYIKNTHAATHSQYKLRLDEVFKISRHGEYEKYKKFKDLHNKKLLWHGSRTTNFAGILSQGLRIAPPEAPVTGYMFGKGIYFADMVSKSANYCFTNKSNPIGLLLLCEVALGNMYERPDAEFVQKLPKDKHSTKGLGQTEPDPKEAIVEDGVEIPLGKPVKTSIERSSLLYNEYIVYDVSQVNIKYLLKVKFDWRY